MKQARSTASDGFGWCELKQQTRDGGTAIFIIANLSRRAANAKLIAQLYRDRWPIETAFQRLAQYLNSENQYIGLSPRRTVWFLCCFGRLHHHVRCKSRAWQCAHGVDFIEKNVSGYYVVNEIEGFYQGMMIVIGSDHWIVFRDMAPGDLVRLLRKLAGNVKLRKYQKQPRSPKKPQPKRISMKTKPHASAAEILAERKR